MIKFSKDRVLLVHQMLYQETGGAIGVKDEGLLESALESAFHTFGGKDLYPSKQEKAAMLCYSLISNHAFVDGNKRIGMYVMMAFLEVNGIYLNSSIKKDIVNVGFAVASGQMKYKDLYEWILNNELK